MYRFLAMPIQGKSKRDIYMDAINKLIVRLSLQIDDILYEDEGSIHELSEELSVINPIELITYVFSQPHGYTYPWEFMLAYFKYWKDVLHYQDCVDILNQIKNYGLGLYCYLPFCYKYLNIDLINSYLTMNDIKEEVRHYVVDTLIFSGNIFDVEKIDKDFMHQFEVTKEDLQLVTTRLINQGGKKAKHPFNFQGIS